MRTLGVEGYITLADAAYRLRTAETTLRRYYWWYLNPRWEKPDDLYLPPLERKGRRNSICMKEEDLPKVAEFIEKIHKKYYGIMGEFNATQSWGKRGKQILERKGKNYNNLKEALLCPESQL